MAMEPSFQHAIAAVIVLTILYNAFWQLTVGARRRTMIREKGCLPIKRYPVKDPILGIDIFRENIRNFKDKTFLETNVKRFEFMGCNTFIIPSLRRRIITTIEPENLKTIQALDFKKWSLGRRRKVSSLELYTGF